MKILMAALTLGLFGAAPASAQQATTRVDPQAQYFHPYTPALKGNFQLQPTQGFSIVDPFAGFVRMVQVCVRDAKSIAVMPVPTPMLATLTRRGTTDIAGSVSVGSCVLLEGESISVGLADGTVDPDATDANLRHQLAYMAGSYTILGYYSSTPPLVKATEKD